jgi:hypothetical protein
LLLQIGQRGRGGGVDSRIFRSLLRCRYRKILESTPATTPLPDLQEQTPQTPRDRKTNLCVLEVSIGVAPPRYRLRTRIRMPIMRMSNGSVQILPTHKDQRMPKEAIFGSGSRDDLRHRKCHPNSNRKNPQNRIRDRGNVSEIYAQTPIHDPRSGWTDVRQHQQYD